MNARLLAPLAGALAFLTLAGAGVAYAAVSEALGVDGTATAAETGVAFVGTHASDGLSTGYDEAYDVYANAGAVIVTNTGTRDARYSVTISKVGESLDAESPLPAVLLKDVLRVGARVVADTASCLPSAEPAETLASGSTTFESASLGGSAPATLTPGQSVTLCIETWLPESSIGPFGTTWIDLGIQTALAYSDVDDAVVQANWTVRSDSDAVAAAEQPLVVRQHVLTEDLSLLFQSPIGRYWFDNVRNIGTPLEPVYEYLGGICKAGANPQPARFPGTVGARGIESAGAGQQQWIPGDPWPNPATDGRPQCADGWNSQWRLVPVPGTSPQQWWILNNANVDEFDQTDTPRWTASTVGGEIVNQIADESTYPHQRWMIESRGDGTYRLVSTTLVDTSSQPVCITVGPDLWSGVQRLVAATCQTGADSQGFRFQLHGRPMPVVSYDESVPLDGTRESHPNGYAMTCGGSTTEREFRWPRSWHYEGEVRFELRFDGVTTAGQFTTHTNGHDTDSSGIHVNKNDTSGDWVEAWYAAHGNGQFSQAVQATIWQQITNHGEWTQITQPMTVWLRPINPASDIEIHCTEPTAPPANPVPSGAVVACNDLSNNQVGPHMWSVQILTTQNNITNPNNSQPYAAVARYRMYLGSTLIGETNPGQGYNPQIGYSIQNSQSQLSALVGPQTLRVEQSVDGGVSWHAYAQRDTRVVFVTPAPWSGYPQYQLQCSA